MIRGLSALSFALIVGGCATMDANGNRAEMRQIVTSAAWSAGVPTHIAQAVVQHESGFNPRLRGRAGEYGLGQIKCQTARGVGFDGPCSALLDPATNATYAMKYLRLALDKGGEGCSGIALYQTGIGARPRCTGYARAVKRRME